MLLFDCSTFHPAKAAVVETLSVDSRILFAVKDVC
jgi:hypothetical protein